MSGINVGRWIGGGVVAGAIMWVMEGAASTLYMKDMEAAMQAHGLSMETGPATIAVSVLASLIAGLALIFFYAGVRPRFGPGPRTAVRVAVALWLGGYLLFLLGYQVLGLFPAGMLVLWGTVGLVEMILACLVGAWLYREA